MSVLRRRFVVNDLMTALEGTDVVRTVLVQTQPSLAETRSFLRLALVTPLIAGVVGWVDLTANDVGKTLERLLARPAGGHLVGIRHQAHDEADSQWLTRRDVRRGIEAVGNLGLTYDLLVRPRELPAALSLARQYPNVRFVIDHLAKPRIQDGVLEPWAESMARLSDLPNVYCKLSGMVTEAHRHNWSVAQIRPFFEEVLKAFGSSRLMFGSDWPVCLVAASYRQVVALTISLIQDLDPAEQDNILAGTAVEFYRLDAKPNWPAQGLARRST